MQVFRQNFSHMQLHTWDRKRLKLILEYGENSVPEPKAKDFSYSTLDSVGTYTDLSLNGLNKVK